MRISDKRQQELHDNIKDIEGEIKRIKKEIRENNRKIKELERYFERISNIFKTDDLSIAKGRLSRLVNHLEDTPECVAKAVRRIERNFPELTLYLRDDRVPKTNNQSERYFGKTLPRPSKRKYRTEKGLRRKLKTERINWIERNVLKIQKPINKLFEYKYQKVTA